MLMTCQRNQPNNPYAHGVATLLGMKVDAYFDLGGIRILLNDDNYQPILQAINEGRLKDTCVVTPSELGFGARGIPIDVACVGEGQGESSIVWIKKWMRTTISITTRTGMQHVLTQQVVGFVRRSTPLLIIGQEGCKLCGYKTIEEQDVEMQRSGYTSSIAARSGTAPMYRIQSPLPSSLAPHTGQPLEKHH